MFPGICNVCNYECMHYEKKKVITYKDTEKHVVTEICEKCLAELNKEEHDNKVMYYRSLDDYNHLIVMDCVKCGQFSVEDKHEYNKNNFCVCAKSKKGEIKTLGRIAFKSNLYTYEVGASVDLSKFLILIPADANNVMLRWINTDQNAIKLMTNGRAIMKQESNRVDIIVKDVISGEEATVKIKIRQASGGKPAFIVNKFEDVPDDAWHKKNIDEVVKEGIFNGTSGTTFSPDDPITRGMFVTALARLDKAETSGYANIFADISENAYYKDSISWATTNGIVKGVGNNNFAPEAYMTREEMAVMINNYINVEHKILLDTSAPESSLVKEKFVDDEKISDWAQEAVYSLKNLELVTGKENGNFAPQDRVTRAEAATVLVRLLNKVTVKNI